MGIIVDPKPRISQKDTMNKMDIIKTNKRLDKKKRFDVVLPQIEKR